MVHEIHEDKWINIKYIYIAAPLEYVKLKIPSYSNWIFSNVESDPQILLPLNKIENLCTFQRISLYLITNFSHFHSFCSIWSSIVYSFNFRLSYSCMHTSITRNDHSFFVFFFSHKENNHFGEWKIYMVP